MYIFLIGNAEHAIFTYVEDIHRSLTSDNMVKNKRENEENLNNVTRIIEKTMKT